MKYPQQLSLAVEFSEPSNQEFKNLIATIIGGKTPKPVAERVMDYFPNISLLETAPLVELTQIPGLGPETAKRILAALRLGNMYTVSQHYQAKIACPQDVADFLIPLLGNKEQEYFYVALLNTKNIILDLVELYHGSLVASTLRVPEVFRDAIRQNAHSIIIAHNHPSGDPTPSQEDLSVTAEISKAGKLLGIPVLDHIIIGKGTFKSLKETNLSLFMGESR